MTSNDVLEVRTVAPMGLCDGWTRVIASITGEHAWQGRHTHPTGLETGASALVSYSVSRRPSRPAS
jgi:hypothetical protein